MEDSSTSHIPTVIPQPSEKIELDKVEHSKADITIALSTLDRLYQQNISSYAKTLHEYMHKIENAYTQLELLQKEKEPHNNALLAMEKEIDYEVRLLERLTEEWNQKSIVMHELEEELVQLNHSSDTRNTILKNRKALLEKVHLEIEDIELSLLEHELEKQNILLIAEPIEQKINTLKKSIKALESEKRYIEASQLHDLSPSMQSSKQKLIDTKNTKENF